VKLLLVALALAAVSSPCWRTFRADGISVRYPARWFATARHLTPVTWPPQVLAFASYPLPRDDAGADGCEPKEALDRLPARGIFIYGFEYAQPSPFGPIDARDFPPHPKRFRLVGLARYECLRRSYMVRFRDAGRFFQVHVAFGPRAGAAVRATALRVLDSFRARPARR
jgi:hypothetical protein